jgi:hypothetical protein
VHLEDLSPEFDFDWRADRRVTNRCTYLDAVLAAFFPGIDPTFADNRLNRPPT